MLKLTLKSLVSTNFTMGAHAARILPTEYDAVYEFIRLMNNTQES